MKSTLVCVSIVGSTIISWFSRKQRLFTLSSAEAEYMATSLAGCKAIWLRKLLTGLLRIELQLTVIDCDNQSCIKFFGNLVFHDRSKHIDICYHHIRGIVQRGIITLQYVPTEEKTTCILTKALPGSRFVYLREKLCVVKNTFPCKREC